MYVCYYYFAIHFVGLEAKTLLVIFSAEFYVMFCYVEIGYVTLCYVITKTCLFNFDLLKPHFIQ